MVWCLRIHGRRVGTEVLDKWVSWMALKNWVVAGAQSSAGCCNCSWSSEEQWRLKLVAEHGKLQWRMCLLMNRNCTTYHLLSAVWVAIGIVIMSGESAFSSADDGLMLVYIPWGEHYNSWYMLTSTCSGHVSVYCWGWISHEEAGILQYKHKLKYVMVLFVTVLYPDRVIQFQQDDFSIHNFYDRWSRPVWNSLTGYREHLIWTLLRICGMRAGKPCR